MTYVGNEDTLSANLLVRFGPESRQGYSPVSKCLRVSPVLAHQSFSTLTDHVNIRIGSSGAIVLVGEGESGGILVGKLGLGADTPETPCGGGSKRVYEHRQMIRALGKFTER